MTAEMQRRIGIQQRVLPMYRAAFFDSLAGALPGTLSIFAGAPRPKESIPQAESLQSAAWIQAANHHLGRGKLSALYQGGWREWIAQADLEILILEANPRYLSNYSLANWMHTRERPVIGWSLGPARTGRWMQSFYEKFSALIVYSRTGAEAFHKLGIAEEKIFVAPNAVESKTAEFLLTAGDTQAEGKAKLGLDDRPLILFVGRLQERKRVDALLRVCAGMANACQLAIVGEGDDRARLERIAEKVFPAAHFTGDLRGEALGQWFHAADLFVLPGTGGLALQEAMLYGKPVAAAQADGSQRDLIREGENGWLLPPGDERALGHVISEALKDPRRLGEMGAASRRIVRETATMEKMIAGFLKAIQFVTRSAGRKS